MSIVEREFNIPPDIDILGDLCFLLLFLYIKLLRIFKYKLINPLFSAEVRFKA